MAFSRSERRHHYARMVVRRYHENLHSTAHPYEVDYVWARNNARRRADTGALCSCGMCRTPRKFKGVGRNGLTRQELVALLTLHEYPFDL
jgi:hypothetical protein